MIQHIDMHAVLQETLPDGAVYRDLVTRPTGRVVRERIELVIAARREGDAVPVARMDFQGVGCIDCSCADEIVAKLLLGGRGERTVLVLTGISDGHREAIEPVLAGHGLAALVEGPDGVLEAVGHPAAAEALFEQLVARRLAVRTPGGTFALTHA